MHSLLIIHFESLPLYSLPIFIANAHNLEQFKPSNNINHPKHNTHPVHVAINLPEINSMSYVTSPLFIKSASLLDTILHFLK